MEDIINKYLNSIVEAKSRENTAFSVLFCTQCKILMELAADSYECPQCRITKPLREENIVTEKATSRTFYGVNVNYNKTQLKDIRAQLFQCRNDYKGEFSFSTDILNEVAEIYNSIQRIVCDVYDEYGRVSGTKKFVKRGSVKDEVLAAILFKVCLSHQFGRVKRDIAKFMKLDTDGFSQGESILHGLIAEKHIEFKKDTDLVFSFANRYMRTLGIIKSDLMRTDLTSARAKEYRDFIIDIVKLSDELQIAMDCQISSKVVGALWIVITYCKLPYSSDQLERAADNIKKNTFNKFVKHVTQLHLEHFTFLFVKYSIH